MNEPPTPPDALSEELVERVDSLGTAELRHLQSYVGDRIAFQRTPIEEEIAATASGEVLNVETHGAYALVRMRLPDPDDADAGFVSLYHVSREQRLDGTESLNWAYLGDVEQTDRTRCETCGRTRPADADGCPYCTDAEPNASKTEE